MGKTRLLKSLFLALLLAGCGWFGSESTDPAQPETPTQAAPAEAAPETDEGLFGNWFTWAEDPDPEPEPMAQPEPVQEPEPEPEPKGKPWTLAGWLGSLFSSSDMDDEGPSLRELNQLNEGSAEDRQARIQAYVAAKLQNIHTIYVQSFTGENLSEVRKGLYAAMKEQGHYEVVEILPDDTSAMAVLRIKVEDYSIWDNEETFDLPQRERYSEETRKLLPERIVRRNALVGVSLSLFDAQTGMPLVRGRYSQPFQQIYVGEDIARMPKPSREMQRLTKILITKILDAFEAKETDLFGNAKLDLERGTGWGWFADEIHDPGNRRIMKGIDLAQAGELERAMGLWKLVLYSPERGEPQEIYRINRASAYYNLGVLYQQQGDHLFAAKMFSQANRLVQKLKYAQAWGDNMHAWLDRKADRNRDMALEVVLPEPTEVENPPKKQADVIHLLESNPNLLLKAQDLWPLEPVIKNAQPGDLNGTQRSELDEQPQRLDKQGYIHPGLDDHPPAPLPQRKERGADMEPGRSQAPAGGLILPTE